MKTVSIKKHYDTLLAQGNDPVCDPPHLRQYMDKWDGLPFLDALALTGQERVLEIGCGTGRLALRVAPFAKEFHGIDLSKQTIAQAKKHLQTFSNVSMYCGDFLNYRLRGAFDRIYASLVFFHFPDKEAAFHRVAELLHPNGLFLLSTDKNPAEWIDIGSHRLRIYPDTPEEILRAGKLANLRCIRQFDMEFAHGFVWVKGQNSDCKTFTETSPQTKEK